MEKRQPSYTIGRNVIGTVTMENSMEFPLKTKNRAAIWSSNPTPEKTIHPEKSIIWKDTCSPMFTAALFRNDQDMDTT